MSGVGHQRRFECAPATSAFPPDSRRIAVSQQMTFRAQKQSRLFDYSLVDVPTGKISWKTAPCAYPGDADSDPP